MAHPLTNAAEAVTASDSGTGSANAAEVHLGPVRRTVNVHVDTSGAATLTVEVYDPEQDAWLTFDTVDYSSATVEVEAYALVAWPKVRASLGSNRNSVTVAGKGV